MSKKINTFNELTDKFYEASYRKRITKREFYEIRNYSAGVQRDIESIIISNILSDEEKMLVENRYFKDLTQSEVAKIMDVNQVYVSRMEKKVLKKMKSKMTS